MLPHFFRLNFASKLCINSSKIKRVTRIDLGIVIIAVNEGACSALFTGINLLEEHSMRLIPAWKWLSVLVPNVSGHLYTLESPVHIIKDMALHKVTLKKGFWPIQLCTHASSLARPTSDWIINFTSEIPKLGDWIFTKSGRLTELQCHPRIAQCNRCLGHHPAEIWSWVERYRRCGSMER